MDPTLEIAALSMQADAQRLGTLSQNLANAATPGYKRLIDVRSAFAGLLDGPAAQPAGAVVTDFSAGSLRHTGQALDLVADGGAFLELRSERQGLRYVRSGSFRVDADGRVVNAAGDVLQLAGGDLVLRGAQRELQVDARGAVHAGGERVGQLRLVRFDAPDRLTALGGGAYAVGDARIAEDSAAAAVRSGYAEASNVQSTQEMVRLLETSRHFEAMQKVVQGYDDVMGTAIRKLGEI